MRHGLPSRIAGLVLAGILTVPMVATSLADSLLLTVKTCTTINCDALVLPGRLNSHPTGGAGGASPWVNKVAVAGVGCLRLNVVSQTTDLAMTVVGPDGTIYGNDNGAVAPCANCPKVVISGLKNGVYTIVVGQRAGASAEASFDLRAGRYAAGSVNCLTPTPPR